MLGTSSVWLKPDSTESPDVSKSSGSLESLQVRQRHHSKYKLLLQPRADQLRCTARGAGEVNERTPNEPIAVGGARGGESPPGMTLDEVTPPHYLTVGGGH